MIKPWKLLILPIGMALSISSYAGFGNLSNAQVIQPRAGYHTMQGTRQGVRQPLVGNPAPVMRPTSGTVTPPPKPAPVMTSSPVAPPPVAAPTSPVAPPPVAAPAPSGTGVVAAPAAHP